MKRIILIIALAGEFLTLSCSSAKSKNCYPTGEIRKAIILLADTTILGTAIRLSENPSKVTQVGHGIGFVERDGTLLQSPSFRLEITGVQLARLLNILRPTQTLTDFEVTDCTPVYRHAVLLYDHDNNIRGQINICFDCEQTAFIPSADCLENFDQQRFKELLNFFHTLHIPMKD